MAKKKPAIPDLSFIAEGLRSMAVPIADLVFDPRNAKKHGQRDLTAIAASMRTYGVLKPAVVRKSDRKILAGNGSVQAASEINGWKFYPVLFVEQDDNTAAGFALADNRTSELAEWDTDRLQELLAEVDFSVDEDLAAMGSEWEADLEEIANQGAAAASRVAAGGDDPNESKPKRGSGGSRPQGPPSEKWTIVVTCSDEQHQTDLLQRFESEGLQCRAIVT